VGGALSLLTNIGNILSLYTATLATLG